MLVLHIHAFMKTIKNGSTSMFLSFLYSLLLKIEGIYQANNLKRTSKIGSIYLTLQQWNAASSGMFPEHTVSCFQRTSLRNMRLMQIGQEQRLTEAVQLHTVGIQRHELCLGYRTEIIKMLFISDFIDAGMLWMQQNC